MEPFELRPNAPEDGWELPERIRKMKDAPDNPLKLRAKELGITLVERDRIPSSRRAHEASEYARSQGKLAPFHATLLAAYWTEGADLHAWDVLAKAAVAAELDPAAMQAAVESGAFERAVDERVAAAHELGIHAVPTYVIDMRAAVQGAQRAETFEKLFAQLGIRPR